MTSLEREAKIGEKVVESISSTFVGKRAVVRKMVAGALGGGHILFEDYPGLGKTLLVKAFARSIGVNFNRVQFTPDVLPSDVLGTKIWDQKTSNFKLSKGPIFTNILLADEINRSPPKTQSAMLEAMEERQVTIEGETLRLDSPFFVLATQNPIEQEGSLDLDEPVFVNGELRTGRELLAGAPKPLVGREGETQLFETETWTYALGADGKLQRRQCLLYALPYRAKYVEVTTRTGRRIKVTKNHPLLVNERGVLTWKKAGELSTKDYLVQAARLPELPRQLWMGHDEAVAQMQQKPLPREIPFDEDFAFWVAFLLSDGSIGEKYLEAVQKNYPDALDRWIAISRGYGFEPTVRVRHGVRHARFYSKPLIEYLRIRFGVTGGQDKEIPTRFLSFDAPLAREFLKTFLCLESNLARGRITFTQKSRSNVNVIAHLLLREGIRSWIRHDGRVWRLKIQGADFTHFLKRVGWIDPAKAAILPVHDAPRTSHRVVPVDPEKVLRLVELLGLNSFHTLPGRTPITERPWYGAYVGLRRAESVVSEPALAGFIHDLRREVDERRSHGFWSTVEDDPRVFAAAFGIPMTEVAAELQISKNQVWGTYQGRNSASRTVIHAHLRQRAEARLVEVEQHLAYFEDLARPDVFYDRVRGLTEVDGSETAFGLTVPGPANYLAGLGACGINHNTYPLPEAQLDRFLLKMSTGYPESEQMEAEILMRRIGWQRDDPTQDVRPIITGPAFRELQRIVETKIFIHKDLLLYISKLVRGLRAHPKVNVGPSPRGALGLLKASRAIALMNGRDYVTPDDVKSFAYEALSHRTILAVEHVLDGLTPAEVVKEVLQSVPVPTRFLESQVRAK